MSSFSPPNRPVENSKPSQMRQSIWVSSPEMGYRRIYCRDRGAGSWMHGKVLVEVRFGLRIKPVAVSQDSLGKIFTLCVIEAVYPVQIFTSTMLNKADRAVRFARYLQLDIMIMLFNLKQK
jgi:hypothetical protein